ncbi:MAG: single-stranded DNA-binding protein [Prevotellaceae bacterium]|jgi:single-strand DNA-binding protein|nr:single-stranded DNA-binding protein [Prevotellaceae bacterium]
MQKIIIAGQLGQDAQAKEVGERLAINFSVAVNEKRGDKEATSWYACALWRNKDKAGIASYLKKGTGVIIEGAPDVEAWLSKEKSEPQARIKITVSDLHFMSGTPKKAEEPAAPAPAPEL